MAKPIRELIFQNIKTALQAVKGPPTYYLNVDPECVNIIHGTKSEKAFSEPYIYIYPNRSVGRPEKGEKGKQYKTLVIDIEMWLKSSESKEEMNTLINQALADVERALMIDPTRGGYAIETRYISDDSFMASLISPKCGVIYSIEVDYQITHGDPDSN